jgi:hypothetical protein
MILMGLIPPWYYHAVVYEEQHIPFIMRGEYDYGSIFNPPPVAELTYISAHAVPNIDFGRLFVQWTTVTIAIAALIFIMKDNKK